MFSQAEALGERNHSKWAALILSFYVQFLFVRSGFACVGVNICAKSVTGLCGCLCDKENLKQQKLDNTAGREFMVNLTLERFIVRFMKIFLKHLV